MQNNVIIFKNLYFLLLLQNKSLAEVYQFNDVIVKIQPEEVKAQSYRVIVSDVWRTARQLDW